MTFPKAKAAASIFSLGIHAIVVLVLFYRFGAYLPIMDLPQIQTISLILPMPAERPRPAVPVKVALKKNALRKKIIKSEETGPSRSLVIETATDNRKEERALPPDNEKADKTTPPSMKVQAEDAGVAAFSEEDKRVGEGKKEAPVVLSSGQGETLAFPLATRGPLAGSSARGKTGEGDSLSQAAGRGKARSGEKLIWGNAPMNTSGEKPSSQASAGGEALSGGSLVVAAPRYGENSLPAYPLLARRRGYAGVVMLSVEVLTDGSVGHIEVKKTSGYDLLDRSALEAVRGWKFSPGKKAGLPVVMRVDVPVRFALN